MTGVRRSSRLSSAQTAASSRPARFLPTRNKPRPPLPPSTSTLAHSQNSALTPSFNPPSKLHQPNLSLLSASSSTLSFAESDDDIAMSPPPSFHPKPPPFPSQSTLSSFPTSSSLASSLGIGSPPVHNQQQHSLHHKQPPPPTSNNLARSIFPQPPQVIPLQQQHPSLSPDPTFTPAEHHAVDSWILSILRTWGRATRHMARYEMKLAVEEFDHLPREVTRGNARICALVGKCWYEMVDYVKAKRAFLQSRLLDPYILFQMDTFSTLLWHTSSPLLLSLLAQELLAISRTDPEPWIALGNAFSLEKEHDEAMRCFRRAAQVALSLIHI